MTYLNVFVEGPSDEAVADRLIAFTGHNKGVCFAKHGCQYIKNNISRYNQAARVTPCLTLIDFMDTGLQCPGNVPEQWLPNRHPNMLFRVVVREIESWLLADVQGISRFLGIKVEFVPDNPERLPDPKREMINLARRSRVKGIREAFLPKPVSTAPEGPLYTSEIIRFIQTVWDIETARRNAPSLDRCIMRLEELDQVVDTSVKENNDDT